MVMYIPDTTDNKICKFERTSEVEWQCSVCQQKVVVYEHGSEMPVLPCKGNTKAYIQQTTKHHTENSEFISQRYEICKACEFFKDNTCGKCGCLVSSSNIYINKLSNKKDKCPIDKW
jgi:hypothetical protein